MAKKSKKTMEDDWWNFGETMKQEVMTGDMSKDMTSMSSLITSIFFNNMYALKLDWYGLLLGRVGPTCTCLNERIRKRKKAETFGLVVLLLGPGAGIVISIFHITHHGL